MKKPIFTFLGILSCLFILPKLTLATELPIKIAPSYTNPDTVIEFEKKQYLQDCNLIKNEVQCTTFPDELTKIKYYDIDEPQQPTNLNGYDELYNRRTSKTQTFVKNENTYLIKVYQNDTFIKPAGDIYFYEIKTEFVPTTEFNFYEPDFLSFNPFEFFPKVFAQTSTTSATNGQDVSIDGGGGGANSSTDLYVMSHSSNQGWRSISQWDIPSIPETGAEFVNIDIYMYKHSDVGTTACNIEMHRMDRDNWTEGATWTTYDGTNSWTSAGGDYSATTTDSVACTDTTSIWQNWTVLGTNATNPDTNLDWGDTFSEYFKVDLSPGSSQGERYRPSEYTTASERPYMIIEYQVEEEATSTPSTATTTTILPDGLRTYNDITIISGYAEEYTDSTSTPSKLIHYVFHIPFFLWVLFWVLISFIFGRLILEFIIRLRS